MYQINILFFNINKNYILFSKKKGGLIKYDSTLVEDEQKHLICIYHMT